MVEVVVLPQDQRLPYTCHQYRVRICIKGKWKTLSSKTAAKDRLGGGRNNKSKEKKGRSNTPLSILSRGTKEDTPLGSVIL